MANEIVLTRAEEKEAFREVNEKSDRIMSFAILAYFGFGLFLSTFYGTLVLALGIGGLCVAVYFVTRSLLPETSLYQYVMSAVLAVFSAQFIYQMHGMFEMHFFFFVGSALLITFRNWRLVIPLLLLTVVHHTLFAWLQYNGMKEIYFTQLDYMDLQAFLFHALLAAVIMSICGYWAYDLERTTRRDAFKNIILAKQLANVKSNIAFADSMSKGNLNVEYGALDNTDALGKSLILMQENLRIANAREQEDKFITVGITKVSDIIRHHGNDFEKLSHEFISGLVKYTQLNQGALFLQEEDENGEAYLTLSACYAYDRKKHLQMRVGLGEGLVGQCYLERDEIYLTKVPENYTRITSGLGEATPGCILLVPVKTQDAVVGVIELASFRPLLPHEKQFIHKAAENIASAIISSRTTDRIKRLLTESQQKAEELRAQEEEMRQNMEELSATQEEMSRKATETENRINAIEESGISSIEFDLDGTILQANRHFLGLMGYSLNEITGKHHRIFVDPKTASSADYAEFWEDLRRGVPRPGEYSRVTKSGARVFIKGSYSIIRDQQGKPVRILKLATDITQLKKQQELMIDEKDFNAPIISYQ
ncbi:PAS domain S-box protein [Chryseolinea lacunae]|uniref:PAS domain S-box protein n=1 Tax=Chryseolinea lacunae TaxID=2801331 RepID=A0ABS1KRL9_9BACT|nr:PAS domain S-box protein [Chryseolinea lacunae]MBL0742089.1 PAS domain S-box protein [Chryseolinea lacunae]